MSTTSDITFKIAKIVGEMIKSEQIVEVETVYAKLVEEHGAEIFQAEHLLAQGMIRGKIKSHLKSAHSVNREDASGQLSLLSDTMAAILSVKQADGGYAYVPLTIADVGQIQAVTEAKKTNIRNARKSLKVWSDTTKPIVAIMKEEGVNYGKARALHLDWMSAATADGEETEAAVRAAS